MDNEQRTDDYQKEQLNSGEWDRVKDSYGNVIVVQAINLYEQKHQGLIRATKMEYAEIILRKDRGSEKGYVGIFLDILKDRPKNQEKTNNKKISSTNYTSELIIPSTQSEVFERQYGNNYIERQSPYHSPTNSRRGSNDNTRQEYSSYLSSSQSNVTQPHAFQVTNLAEQQTAVDKKGSQGSEVTNIAFDPQNLDHQERLQQEINLMTGKTGAKSFDSLSASLQETIRYKCEEKVKRDLNQNVRAIQANNEKSEEANFIKTLDTFDGKKYTTTGLGHRSQAYNLNQTNNSAKEPHMAGKRDLAKYPLQIDSNNRVAQLRAQVESERSSTGWRK